MAASIMTMKIPPVGVQPRPASGHRKLDVDSRKIPSNWWIPLFGWSNEPDYLESDQEKIDRRRKSGGGKPVENQDLKPSSRSRFVPGSFTEEKARKLRKMTRETSAFHDVMYHSAVASRLASDFSERSGQ